VCLFEKKDVNFINQKHKQYHHEHDAMVILIEILVGWG